MEFCNSKCYAVTVRCNRREPPHETPKHPVTKKTVFYADWAPAGYDFGKNTVRELATDVPDANGADVPQKKNQMKKERTPCPFPFVHILKT